MKSIPKTRLAGDDLLDIRIRLIFSDDPIVFRVLHLQRFGIGHRHGGGRGREFAVACGALAGIVMHAAGSGGAFGGGNIPLLRGGGDEHLAATCADLPHRLPVHRRCSAAAGNLNAVLGIVQIALLDFYVLPFGVEFLGDQHGQHDFDALADFGILGNDGDRRHWAQW